jgi:ABC-type glycerol-3-phosphate transport system substrate-binding protein
VIKIKIEKGEKRMRKILVLAMALALVAALAVPLAALAAPIEDTDTTTVSGTVAVAIEVTAPASAGLGSMEIGDNELASAITVSVNCTQTGWTLGAADKRVSPVSAGHMDDTTTALIAALQIKGGDQASYTALSGTDVPLETTGAGAAGQTDISDINFNQKVEYADTAGAYSIIITFTGTATP